jgi:hypothetical protein
VTLEAEVGAFGPWCRSCPWIRIGSDLQGLDLGWLITEVNDGWGASLPGPKSPMITASAKSS